MLPVTVRSRSRHQNCWDNPQLVYRLFAVLSCIYVFLIATLYVTLGSSHEVTPTGPSPIPPLLPKPTLWRWAPLPSLWELLSEHARLASPAAADELVQPGDLRQSRGGTSPSYAKPPPIQAAVLDELALPSRIHGLLSRKVDVIWSQAACQDSMLDRNFTCGKHSIMSFTGPQDITTADTRLQSLLPAKDSLAGVKLGSCAVVGNSGNLLSSGHGAAIDSHDTVFRFNAAPTAGYEADVGQSTAFRLQNCDHIGFREPQDEIMLASVRTPADLRRFAAQRRQPGADWQFMFHPEFWCHVWDWVAHRKLKPSSGLAGVVLALRSCTPPVDLYGFNHKAGEFHYWNRLPDKVTQQDVYKYHPLQEEAFLYQELQDMQLVRLWR